MKNMSNEEKSFKRFLKRKLSFNLENLVKLLITGTLAFTVTACGGGGGSSSNVKKEVPSTINKLENTFDNVKKTLDDINKTKQEADKVVKDLETAKDAIDKISTADIKNEKDLNNLIESIDETNRLKEKAKKELENVKNKDDAQKINKEIDELEKSLENLKDDVEKAKENIKNNNTDNEFDIGNRKTYEVEDKTKGKIIIGTITDGELYPDLDKELEDKYKEFWEEEELDPNDPNYEEKKKEREEDKEVYNIGMLIKDKNFKTRSKVNINIKNIDIETSYGVFAVESDFENLGKISVGDKKKKYTEDDQQHGVGIFGVDSNIKNSADMEIVGDDSIGIWAGQSKVDLGKKVINTGKIKGFQGAGGISVFNGMTAINDGEIESSGEWAGGLGAVNANLKNNKTISLNGDNAHGISIETNDGNHEIEAGSFTGENYGTISIKGNNSTGMYAGYEDKISKVSSVSMKNHGTITIDGMTNERLYYTKDLEYITSGMIAIGEKNIIENHGTINIENEGYGMIALKGATAINGKNGVINIKGSAYRMLAEKGGSVIDEKKSNSAHYADIKKIKTIKRAGMFADKDSTIKNLGTIKIDDELKITSNFSVDTDRSGGYGKISAFSVQMDGDINVSSEITKKDYKNKYELKNMIKADNKLKIKENLKAKTDSDLYELKTYVDDNNFSGDLELIKKEKFTGFVPLYLKDTASTWYDAIANEDKSQEIIDILSLMNFSNSTDFKGKKIKNAMKSVYPNIYSNLAREISSKNKLFNSKDKLAINNLYGNKYGFVLLNEYKDIKNYNHIPGYKTNQSGFVGTVDLGNNLYGNIGYAYDDIKYKGNGNSKIHTIHLGLNKNTKVNDVDLEFALSGEYNFHKNTREMKNFDTVAKSKFNSYSIGTSAKVSKKFGDDLYIKPFSKIELAYMKHKGFTEKNAGVLNTKFKAQSYTSILPQVGFKLGKDFENISLFADLTYGYELGSLNKAEEFSYEHKDLDGTAKLVKDDLEKGRLTAKVGANYHKNNFTVGLNLGQDFDKRGNKFVNFSIGYKF